MVAIARGILLFPIALNEVCTASCVAATEVVIYYIGTPAREHLARYGLAAADAAALDRLDGSKIVGDETGQTIRQAT